MLQEIISLLPVIIALTPMFMTITLAQVKSGQVKNPTGYKRFWVTAIENITSIPAPTGHVISGDIVMEAAQVFYKFIPDGQGGAWSTSEEDTSEGTTGDTVTFSAFFAGDTAALKASLEPICGVDLIILAEKKDGVIELLGEVDRGIRLTRNKEDGAKPGTRKGYLLSGQNDFNNLPYEYTGTIPE